MDHQFPDLPLGLGMGLIMNRHARDSFEGLSETEKEHIIFKCKDAKSKKEMDKIINSLSQDEGVAELFQGPGMG